MQIKPLFLALMIGLVSASHFATAQTKKKKQDKPTTPYMVSGPMLGNVEHRSAYIWAEVSREADRVALEYWKTNDVAARKRVDYKGELTKTYNPIAFRLEELEMNTDYTYNIYVNEVLQTSANPLHFKTKELWEYRKPAPDFDFVIGSCLYLNDSIYDRPGKPYGKGTKILEPLAKEKADFNIWMGDNLYFREADFSSVAGMAYRYSHDRATAALQTALAVRPNYATWDDHDYGPNDSDEAFRFQAESRQLFMQYWGNPTYGRGEKGIYTSFTWSDCEFFMLDDRFFRASDNLPDMVDGKPNKDKIYWGKEQLKWLKDGLASSRSTFKFVINGGQFTNPFDKRESAVAFPDDQQELMSFLETQRVNGVIFLSGDRHFSEVLTYKLPSEKAYTMYEITNSSLGASTYASMKEPELSNPARVKGSLINQENNYGVLHISGDKNNRKIRYEVKNNEGKPLYEFSIGEKDLKWVREKEESKE
jgi:alkaline phosphatase D